MKQLIKTFLEAIKSAPKNSVIIFDEFENKLIVYRAMINRGGK